LRLLDFGKEEGKNEKFAGGEIRELMATVEASYLPMGGRRRVEIFLASRGL